MNAHYPRVAARAGHRCEYCHAPEAIFNFPFEVEHIVPTSQEGADDEENMALACRACNLFKSDHVTGTDPETGETFGLFQPRLEEWGQHFRVEIETGFILGTAPTGRATVARLHMNSPIQQVARQQ